MILHEERPITSTQVLNYKYPEEDVKTIIFPYVPVINQLLQKNKYQLDVQRYEYYGFMKKRSIKKRINISLWNIIERTRYAQYLNKLSDENANKWMTNMCEEIKIIYDDWNIKYIVGVMKYEITHHYKCELYFYLK